MSKKQMFCPRCGKKMTLVAAGWYCMNDDYLIDPVTGRPIESLFVPSIRRGPEIVVKERPSEITVVVVLEVVGGVLELLAGLALLFLSAFLTRFLPMGIPFMPGLFGLVTLIAVGGVIIALIDLLIAWGLWAGRGWAWVVGLILVILRLIGGLLILIAGLVTLPMIVIGMIEQILIIYLLTRPRVKAFLGREAALSPAPQAAGPI